MKPEIEEAEVYVARETISRNVAIWVENKWHNSNQRRLNSVLCIIVHQSQFSFFIGGRVRIIY